MIIVLVIKVLLQKYYKAINFWNRVLIILTKNGTALEMTLIGWFTSNFKLKCMLLVEMKNRTQNSEIH